MANLYYNVKFIKDEVELFSLESEEIRQNIINVDEGLFIINIKPEQLTFIVNTIRNNFNNLIRNKITCKVVGSDKTIIYDEIIMPISIDVIFHMSNVLVLSLKYITIKEE